jgi:hypothetical protein
MSPLSWMAMLPVLVLKAKQNFKPDLCCPLCHEHRRIVRYGRYWRYFYESHERMAVQRYACRNPACPRRTFSVLPHAYLPMLRIPLCLQLELYRRHVVDCQSINRLARALHHGWNTIRRAVDLARRLLDWCRREITAEAMDPWPCRPVRWPAFCRAFSYAFMPARLTPKAVNTIR